MALTVTGLDIGTKSIKLVQLKRGRGDSVTVTGYGSIDIPATTEKDINTVTADALKQLIAQTKIHPVNLITAIPKQFVVVRYLTLPTNSVDEVQQMIRFEATKFVPFLSEEDIVDFELIGSSPLGGSEVLLVVSRRTAVEEHLALLKNLHYEPFSAGVSSLALFRALRHTYPGWKQESEKTQLVVELGNSLMEISLIQNQSLRYTRTATVAGSQLVSLLQENLSIPESDAYQLITRLDLEKPNYGIDNHPAEKLDDAVGSWLGRMNNEIKRSIDYFAGEFNIPQIHSIILSGGLVRLNHLREYLEKETGIPVSIANLLPELKHTSSTEFLPQYNTAYGLALRPVDAKLGEAINLLPPEILQKRIRRKRQKLAVQLISGILVLAMVGIVFGYQQYTKMEEQLVTIDKELIAKKPQSEKLAEMKEQLDSIKQIVGRTDAGIETLSALSKVDMIPSRVTLERFIYERNKTITVYAAAMSMEDAVNFRFILERTELFNQVAIQNANQELMEGKPVVKFQVLCKFNPEKTDSESKP